METRGFDDSGNRTTSFIYQNHHHHGSRLGQPTMTQIGSHGDDDGEGPGLEPILSRPSTLGDGLQGQGRGRGPRPRRRVWFTAKTILGTCSVLFALAMLGISIKMVAKYGDTGLVHVSFICVGFTVAAAVVWQALELMAMCARPDHRGLYPGAHVGVHICICLACVATVGYVGIWVSDGNHDWKYIPAPGNGDEVMYSPLYHMGIVLLVLTVVLLLINFVLAIIACQIVKRKDDVGAYRAVVTVRYDGVGPSGTDRPRDLHFGSDYIYSVRQAPVHVVSVPPVVITRQDLGREVVDEPPSRSSISPRPSEKAR